MNGFHRWLVDIANPQLSGTAPEGAAPLGRRNLEPLRQSLRYRLAANERYFQAAFVLAAILALATLGAAFWERATAGTWTPAALGLSTAGAVGLTMRYAREKALFEVMLELATGLDEAAVRNVLEVMLKRQGRRDAAAMPLQSA
jgi:hypothetical protein